MTENLLGKETSPYLLQHRDNPVHWQPWGPEALALAERAQKPILLSVGYAACHWCHVMAHESFEDPETAKVMNALFINIKVDREERPDIDMIYMNALTVLGEQGGWPLTMFLTPQGAPVWGGTYFPNTPKFGRPAFVDVLHRIAKIFAESGEMIDKNKTGIIAALDQMSRSRYQGEIDKSVLKQVAEQFAQQIDGQNGGFGGAPKFPQCHGFELLWRAYLRTGNLRYRNAVTLTLDHICQGGIYDHLGGGFARYAVDQRWLAPHFEKMLYDNAQLIELMTLVWQKTRSPLYAQRIRETITWILREMSAPEGGFAASLDADSAGEEGKFYVWSSTEIDDILGSDAAYFKEIYDVSATGNWEGVNILNRLHHLELLPQADEDRLAKARARLMEARAPRTRPGWDDKVLADWNGLMISALTFAGMVFHEPAWLEAAQAAFRFIVERMTTSADHDGARLLHSYRGGRAQHTAMLDDYAAMARAALSLYEATGEPDYLASAQHWAAILERYYWNEEAGGYYFTATDAEALITRTRLCHDNATPAGNAVMIGVLSRLYHLTGNDHYLRRAEQILQTFAADLDRNAFSMATFLNSFETYTEATQIVILGKRGDPATTALLDALYSHSLPNRVIQILDDSAALPENHPAGGKTASGGQATVYICTGQTCSRPVTDPEQLVHILPGAALERGGLAEPESTP